MPPPPVKPTDNRYTVLMHVKVIPQAPQGVFVGYHIPQRGQLSYEDLLIAAARRQHPRAHRAPNKIAELLEQWLHEQGSMDFEAMPQLWESLEAHLLGTPNPHPDSALQRALTLDAARLSEQLRRDFLADGGLSGLAEVIAYQRSGTITSPQFPEMALEHHGSLDAMLSDYTYPLKPQGTLYLVMPTLFTPPVAP